MHGEIIWTPGITLEAMEKLIVLAAYRFYRQNKVATATSLGIAVRTLDNKLEQYLEQERLEKERQQNALRERTEFLARQRGNPPNNEGVIFTPGNPEPVGIERMFNAGAQKTQDARLREAADRSRMESTPHAPAQHAVPVSESVKVQTVLPKQAPQNRGYKGR